LIYWSSTWLMNAFQWMHSSIKYEKINQTQWINDIHECFHKSINKYMNKCIWAGARLRDWDLYRQYRTSACARESPGEYTHIWWFICVCIYSFFYSFIVLWNNVSTYRSAYRYDIDVMVCCGVSSFTHLFFNPFILLLIYSFTHLFFYEITYLLIDQ